MRCARPLDPPSTRMLCDSCFPNARERARAEREGESCCLASFPPLSSARPTRARAAPFSRRPRCRIGRTSLCVASARRPIGGARLERLRDLSEGESGEGARGGSKQTGSLSPISCALSRPSLRPPRPLPHNTRIGVATAPCLLRGGAARVREREEGSLLAAKPNCVGGVLLSSLSLSPALGPRESPPVVIVPLDGSRGGASTAAGHGRPPRTQPPSLAAARSPPPTTDASPSPAETKNTTGQRKLP